MSISITPYPMVVQEIANKVERAVGSRYELEYYDHCEFNCPYGCGAIYECELYIVDKNTDEAVAKLEWTEKVECSCYDTICEPDRRALSKPIKLEVFDEDRLDDRKAKLEKIIERINSRLAGEGK